MSKMRFFLYQIFKNRQLLETLRPQGPVNFPFWWPEVAWFDQKWFSYGLWRNRTLKKLAMTSFQRRHRYYDTKLFLFWAPPNQNFWASALLSQLQLWF